MRKIKVAEFVTRLEFGGVEAMILNYTNNFPDRDKFELHVITQNINDKACIDLFKQNGFVVHIVTHKRESIIKNVVEVNQNLRKEKYDIVHAHMSLMNFYILFLAWINGTKVRISHSHNAFKSDSLIKKAYWNILKLFNKVFANVWIACGVDASNFLYGKYAIKSGKAIILKNAIDVKKYSFNPTVRDLIRELYGLDENCYCVGHIGRFSEQKNHPFLIEVFERVLQYNPTAKLMLIGTGDDEYKIKELVSRKGIDNSVIFVGSVTNTCDYYQAMDVFVLPSLYEGLPVVLVEAQTAGLPCIVSDRVDSRCKLIDDLVFASIDNSYDMWVDLIKSYKTFDRSKVELNAIERAGYSIKIEAEKLQGVYETL